jgi:endonuclease YncB( thermonuclease family)
MPLLVRCAALVALTLAAPSFLPASESFSARVVGVADGDTITVIRDDVPERNPIRIRLYGIDTPEKRQRYYAKAKQFTSDAVFGKTIIVEPRGKHFERIVADVVLPDGRLLNHEIVRAGLAWWFEKYALGDRDLERLQAEARRARRGIWSEDVGVPPWEWRRR